MPDMKAGVLTREQITSLMRKQCLQERLVITPLLDPERQLNPNGVDLRLGRELIVARQTSIALLDPEDRDTFEINVGKYQEKVALAYGESFFLHPAQAVLASTLEYIGLPSDICGQVMSRSSWGRLGLINATAPFIAAGWKGAITLELVNLGRIPVRLSPGYSVAQLILQNTAGKSAYEGRYVCPTSVEHPRLSSDPDIPFWSTRDSFE